MNPCAICQSPIDGPLITDADTGSDFHPACAVSQAPFDAAGLFAGWLAIALTPVVVVWAS